MVSKEFVRIYARICGDGCLSGRYIRYSNKNLDLLGEFERDMRKEFGEVTLTKGIQNSGTPFLQVQLKPVVKVFSDFGSFLSDKIKVPGFIIKGNKILKKEFIRTFFDDEGSPNLRLYNNTKEWKRSITVSSNSKQFLIGIKVLLRDFGIGTNRIIRNSKNIERDKSYNLTISGRENFMLFQKNIGFKSNLKNREVEFILNSYGNTYHRNRKEFNDLIFKLKNLKKDKRKFYKQNFREIFIDGRP